MDCEIVLTVGAVEAVREMQEAEKDQLAAALRRELCARERARQSPSLRINVRGSSVDYFARYLGSGHLVVYRPMTPEELKALPDHEGISSGVVVHDILPGGLTSQLGPIRSA
jgi:hypothetical protein